MSELALLSNRLTSRGRGQGWLAVMLVMMAATITIIRLQYLLPLPRWWSALVHPNANDAEAMLFQYSALPRCAVSILCGSGLGLAGTLFQQVLRNPIAEPSTLGVSAGASLAITIATLWFPSLLSHQEWIALGGAAAAMLLVFGFAWSGSLSSLQLILGGLIVSMLAGTCGAALTLFHHDRLQSIFIWSVGSLDQNNWDSVRYLLIQVTGAALLSVFLIRPLSVLALDDERARSLGLSLRTLRILALAIAVSLSGFVVSAVGVISFVGLAAPILARMTGVRRFRDQIIWSPVMGAGVLWLTDQLVQLFGSIIPGLATGTATALLGTPLLLWMLLRLRHAETRIRRDDQVLPRNRYPRRLFIASMATLAILIWLALDFGQGPHGWNFAGWEDLHELLKWRWPRVLAALAAGMMLAASGNIMQRMTGNAMASPEVLGISSGASLGVIVVIFIVPFSDRALQIVAAIAGAFVTLVAMLALGQRSFFSPQRMLLAGIAVGSIFSAIVSLLLASGDPRMDMLLSWMSGSTYRVTGGDAVWAASIALVGLALVPGCSRWLDILPLGDASVRSVGVNLRTSRLTLLVLASVLTAGATLIVGPLSFVGLVAPHMARMLGLQRSTTQILGAVIIGASIMVLADWLGRNVLFPSQIPAGFLATFVGAPYFLWLMRRTSA